MYGSIDGVKEHTKHDTTILNYERTRILFTEYEQHPLDSVPYCGAPNFEELKKFVTENNLNISFENLEKCFLHNDVIIFEDDETF